MEFNLIQFLYRTQSLELITYYIKNAKNRKRNGNGIFKFTKIDQAEPY